MLLSKKTQPLYCLSVRTDSVIDLDWLNSSINYFLHRRSRLSLMFLPGMTERSSTPSATASGLSEVALEGWNDNNGSRTSARHHARTHARTHFCTSFSLLDQSTIWRLLFIPLPLVAAQLVRGYLSTDFAVEFRAEERHAEAQFKRNPLILRWKAWTDGIIRGSDRTRDHFTKCGTLCFMMKNVDLLSVFPLPSPLFSSVTSSKDSVLPLVSRPPPRWVSPWRQPADLNHH